MSLTRFEPWSVVDLLHRDLSRLTRNRGGFSNEDDAVYDWVPAVDIIELAEQFLLRADLPGVERENIDVSMDGGVLTVSGQRDSIAAENAAFQRLERTTGRFLRRFTLPESANAEGIAAKIVNGVLEVTIPKQPEIKSRRITVESD